MDSLGSISRWNVGRLVTFQNKLQNSNESGKFSHNIFKMMHQQHLTKKHKITPSTVHRILWLVHIELLSPLADLWLVRGRLKSNQRSRLQFPQPFSMGHELGLDCGRMFLRLRRICQQITIGSMHIPIFAGHLLCLPRTSHCYSSFGIKFRCTIAFGQRLYG